MSNFGGRALRVLYIAAACVGALALYQFALAQYTMAQFGDWWIAEYPFLGTYGPLFAIALASGAIVGVVLGVLARSRALPLAAWAGLCVCVLSIAAAAVGGGLAWALANPALVTAPLIAAGLLLGALAGRKLGHG